VLDLTSDRVDDEVNVTTRVAQLLGVVVNKFVSTQLLRQCPIGT
jgi:hypothetical protein